MKKYIFIPLVLACIMLFSACESKEEEMTISNKNAIAPAKAVYEYICETYGNAIISGQQESIWVDSPEYEMNYLSDTTGKQPAMRGFDFMNDDFDGVVERATEWWNKGGIVTICWHCGSDFTKEPNACKDDEIQDWDAVLTDGTAENKAFIKNMDNAGKALLALQKKNIPVLWRPFHEFDGAWFWWGKGGNENFKKLWIMMYDHFTYDLGLNNLIWVLGYSHNGKLYHGKPAEWYPGDEYCDIVGADSYEVSENGAEQRLFKIVDKITHGRKPLIMHECGLIPEIEDLKTTPWASFMTWHSEYLMDANTKQHLKEIYESDYVITLDELPSFN